MFYLHHFIFRNVTSLLKIVTFYFIPAIVTFFSQNYSHIFPNSNFISQHKSRLLKPLTSFLNIQTFSPCKSAINFHIYNFISYNSDIFSHNCDFISHISAHIYPLRPCPSGADAHAWGLTFVGVWPSPPAEPSLMQRSLQALVRGSV